MIKFDAGSLGTCSLYFIKDKICFLGFFEQENKNTPLDFLPDLHKNCVERIKKHLTGESQDLRDIPFDISGGLLTPLTKEILKLVHNIPPGQTKSYKQIGNDLGKPNMARVVANAMSKNPILLLIPCHRVICSE